MTINEFQQLYIFAMIYFTRNSLLHILFNINMNECHVAASFDETETALDEDLDVERHGCWERRSWLP